MNRTAVFLIWAIILFSADSLYAASDFEWMKGGGEASDSSSSSQMKLTQYLLAKAGGYLPEVKFNGKTVHSNVGTGAEAGYGIQPLPYIAAEATVGYFEAEDSDDNLDNQHFQLSVVPMNLALKAIAPLKLVDLYGIIGGSLHYTIFSKMRTTEGDDDFTTGYFYGGGIKFNLMPGSMTVEAKFLEDFHASLNGISVDYSGIQIYAGFSLPF